MKKVLSLTFFLTFLSLLSISSAQSCAVNITWSSNATYTIDQNNTYYCLNQSWYLTVTAIQFASGVQNSTLDCLGYNIDSNDTSDTYGVYLTGSETKNNTIKNCNITDFYDGIYFYGATNGTIINNTLSSNVDGVSLNSSSNNSITKNIAKGNADDGFSLVSNSNYNTLNDNVAENGYGFYLKQSHNNTLYNNTANNNTYNGIFLHESHNNTLYNNTVNYNGDWGVWFATSTFNNFSSNMVKNNDNDDKIGIYLLFSSKNNTLSNNELENNEIYLWGDCDYNTLSSNIVKNNDDGFFLSPGSDYNTLINNTAENNSYGFRLSHNNILINNTAINNTYGFYLPSVSGNNITGGSSHNNQYDYYLVDVGTTNYFRDINFTNSRKIYFNNYTSWFNYNNITANGIWLKTNVSSTTIITRKLTSWTQSQIQWNDSASVAVTARYNITGLLPNTNYSVYNNSVLVYTLQTDSEGNLPSFTISLTTSESEIKVQVAEKKIKLIIVNDGTVNLGKNFTVQYQIENTIYKTTVTLNQDLTPGSSAAISIPVTASGSLQWIKVYSSLCPGQVAEKKITGVTC